GRPRRRSGSAPLARGRSDRTPAQASPRGTHASPASRPAVRARPPREPPGDQHALLGPIPGGPTGRPRRGTRRPHPSDSTRRRLVPLTVLRAHPPLEHATHRRPPPVCPAPPQARGQPLSCLGRSAEGGRVTRVRHAARQSPLIPITQAHSPPGLNRPIDARLQVKSATAA